MPIEIKELVIRTVVTPPAPDNSGASAHGAQRHAAASPPIDLDALVQECVRQVMRMLAQQRER